MNIECPTVICCSSDFTTEVGSYRHHKILWSLYAHTSVIKGLRAAAWRAALYIHWMVLSRKWACICTYWAVGVNWSLSHEWVIFHLMRRWLNILTLECISECILMGPQWTNGFVIPWVLIVFLCFSFFVFKEPFICMGNTRSPWMGFILLGNCFEISTIKQRR